VIHDVFTPVADHFDDYIATPKSNMYQSLHTAVIVPRRSRMVEIQIRTREMNVVSEIGIAAHYAYKEGFSSRDRELQEKLGDFVVQGTTEWQNDARDPREFMDFLKTSLYQDEVFVFTPKGAVKRLPRGATPIDFAYAIHTDVGNRCVGAKANGRIVPLKYQLNSGEVVEVISSPQGQPNEAWLKLTASSRAKAKIRHWLQQERLEGSVRLGREMLARELKKRHLPPAGDKELEDISQSFGLVDVPLLFAKIGEGDLSVASVIARLHPHTRPEEHRGATALEKIRRLASRPVKGIRIGDVDGLLIRMAQCCQPLPGDKVIGIITKGRGISVHRTDCPNTFDDRIAPERRIEVEWDVERDQEFLVRLVVHGSDRPSLLADVAGVISREANDLRHGAMGSDGDGQARGEFIFTVRNLGHFRRVVDAVRRVRGVLGVERTGTSVGIEPDEETES
jgi:guanosine-3',5'-bis(diphosphate) 3'-pyrophosphohydrolase